MQQLVFFSRELSIKLDLHKGWDVISVSRILASRPLWVARAFELPQKVPRNFPN